MHKTYHFLETAVVAVVETMTANIKINYHIVYRISREYLVHHIMLLVDYILYVLFGWNLNMYLNHRIIE